MEIYFTPLSKESGTIECESHRTISLLIKLILGALPARQDKGLENVLQRNGMDSCWIKVYKERHFSL